MLNPIVILGFMGSGKTTLGKRLAASIDRSFIDLDHYIEDKYQHSIPEIFEKEGETEFRRKETFCLQEVLSKSDIGIISVGGGTPCFNQNLQLINDKSHSVYLKLSAQELFNRLTRSPNPRPLVATKTNEELMGFINAEIKNREPFYKQAHQTIESDCIQLNDLLAFLPGL